MYIDDGVLVVGRTTDVVSRVTQLTVLDGQDADECPRLDLLGDDDAALNARLNGGAVTEPIDVVRWISLACSVARQADGLVTLNKFVAAHQYSCNRDGAVREYEGG